MRCACCPFVVLRSLRARGPGSGPGQCCAFEVLCCAVLCCAVLCCGAACLVNSLCRCFVGCRQSGAGWQAASGRTMWGKKTAVLVRCLTQARTRLLSVGRNAPVRQAECLSVLYDGSCPLCRREISVYQGLQPSSPIVFKDISDESVSLPAGSPSRQQLLKRFHVQFSSGEVRSGADGFLALWERLPGWRWLAFVGRAPGAAWAMEQAYLMFLQLRPSMQSVARRWDK